MHGRLPGPIWLPAATAVGLAVAAPAVAAAAVTTAAVAAAAVATRASHVAGPADAAAKAAALARAATATAVAAGVGVPSTAAAAAAAAVGITLTATTIGVPCLVRRGREPVPQSVPVEEMRRVPDVRRRPAAAAHDVGGASA